MDLADIFTNPLIWGLLVWVFSKIFTSKGKEEQKKPKQSSHRSEDKQNPRSTPRPNPRPVPKPVMTTVETKQREERRPPLQSVQEAYEKLKLQPVKEEQNQKPMELPKKSRPLREERQHPTVNRNISRNHLVIDQHEAAQGVVWSEILGAPRAKNPHYTQNRRHS